MKTKGKVQHEGVVFLSPVVLPLSGGPLHVIAVLLRTIVVTQTVPGTLAIPAVRTAHVLVERAAVLWNRYHVRKFL